MSLSLLIAIILLIVVLAGVFSYRINAAYQTVGDWYAAMRRDPNANLMESMESLRKKYKIEQQLYSVILNTVLWLRNGGVR